MGQSIRDMRRRKKFRRALATFGIVILLLLIGESIWLGSKILQRLDGLSTAQTDNLKWNLTRIEAEQLKVENQALKVEKEADLYNLRRAFDVFYSRIVTVRESSVFTPLRQDPEANELLTRVEERLTEMAGLVDRSDTGFMDALAGFRDLMAKNHDDIRDLSLSGLAIYTQENETKRRDLHRHLSQLAAVVFVLVTALGLTAQMLAILYRRGRVLAVDTARTAARMRAMVSSSLDAILVLGSDGRIIEYNGAAEAVFGYARNQAIGLHMDELILDRDHRADFAKLGPQALQEQMPRMLSDGRIELEGLRCTGEVFPVELSLSPTPSGDETVFVSFLRDISDRYAADEELRRARDDALAGERAKANLLTVMSHEMRTPLTGVLGAIDILEADGATAEQRKYLQAMRVSGELLLHHVNDVLELSRLEAGANPEEATVFDLADLVESLVASQQSNARINRNELTVHCNLGRGTTVEGHARAVQQTLLNLVGNALKFTRDGAVMVDVNREGDIVELQVADTGKGIAPEHLEKIFDDFVTLDSSYGRMSEGTGLGLAITRRMVAGMNGEIICDSELGEGSTFVIRVPMPAVHAAEPEISGSTATTRTPARLLVVEDNDVNRELLQRMLELMGHNVTAASGGGEAISLVARNSYDLVLMDISMPDVDGIEATRRIRARELAPNTDIVALTAHAAAEDHRRILDAGFAEVLTKPVDKPSLERVIALRAGCVSEADLGAGDASDVEQFFAALGQEKALGFLHDLQDEFDAFITQLNSCEDVSQQLRSEAHRLAGSAAVLGLSALRECLHEVELENSKRPKACDQVETIWQDSLEYLATTLEAKAAE